MKKLFSLVACSLLLSTTPIQAYTIGEDINNYSFNNRYVDNSNISLSQNSIDFLNKHGIDLTEQLKQFKMNYSPYVSTAPSYTAIDNSNAYVGNLESDIAEQCL